jgi:hypothetical protein
MKSRQLAVLLALAALAGIGATIFLAWHRVTVEDTQPEDALLRFADIRAQFGGIEPLLHVDPAGRVTRRAAPLVSTGPPTQFRVLLYRVSEQRLVRTDLPFWFLKIKGPAVQYALRGTGLDLQRLGVTAADLERYGASLVLDQMSSNGNRLLVWTE